MITPHLVGIWFRIDPDFGSRVANSSETLDRLMDSIYWDQFWKGACQWETWC